MQRGNAKGIPNGQTGKIPVADVTNSFASATSGRNRRLSCSATSPFAIEFAS